MLLDNGPCKNLRVELEALTSFAELSRDIIDFRSRFTATHTSGVAECAATLSRLLGIAEAETRLIEVAGNFHDIGKLVVPNSILEKPVGLSAEEFAIVRQHTYFTFSILSSVGGLENVAEWAAFHHEKLDGSGYPFRKKGDEINTGARIMAVADVFTALSEDRPYRASMSRDKIMGILRDHADKKVLDAKLVEVLLNNYEEVEARTRGKQEAAKEYYEQRFASCSRQMAA